MNGQPVVCEQECNCHLQVHSTELVVITGGPGAGKTAVLEMLKKMLCEHVAILPESASIVFGGGFWRLESPMARIAAQKAIFHMQKDMEELVLEEKRWAMGLCDRGTLDGLAYWPESEESFFTMAGSSFEKEFSAYKAVIHLRSPSEDFGYNHVNPLRIESAVQAQAIDEKIHRVWSQHPNYHQIGSTPNFLEKANVAIEVIGGQLPDCCRRGISEFLSKNSGSDNQALSKLNVL